MKSDSFTKQLSLILLFGFFLVIGTIIILILIYKSHFPGPISSDHSRWAEFGTLFGGVIGTVSTLLTLLILVLTLSIQNRQLIVSNNSLSQQIKSIKKQSFNFEFFEILKSISNHINSTPIQFERNNSNSVVGVDSINLYLERAKSRYRNTTVEDNEKSSEIDLIKYSIGVDDIFYRNSINPLLKIIILAIDYLYSSGTFDYKYHDILRAQLSENIIFFLFYDYLIGQKHDEKMHFFLSNYRANKLELFTEKHISLLPTVEIHQTN